MRRRGMRHVLKAARPSRTRRVQIAIAARGIRCHEGNRTPSSTVCRGYWGHPVKPWLVSNACGGSRWRPPGSANRCASTLAKSHGWRGAKRERFIAWRLLKEHQDQTGDATGRLIDLLAWAPRRPHKRIARPEPRMTGRAVHLQATRIPLLPEVLASSSNSRSQQEWRSRS